MSGNGRILFLGSGISRESRKIKGGPAGEGEMGEGVRHGWERQREITEHEIYLIVPKKESTRTVNLAQSKELRV